MKQVLQWAPVRDRDRRRHTRAFGLGDIDLEVKEQFHNALQQAVAGANSPLVIDLSSVRYIDSLGFNALFETQRQMDARPDKLYFVIHSPLLLRLFAMLNLDKISNLYPTMGEALAAAKSGADPRLKAGPRARPRSNTKTL